MILIIFDGSYQENVQYQHQYEHHDLKWFLPGKCQEQVLRFQLLGRRQEPFKMMVNSLTIFSPKIFQDGGEYFDNIFNKNLSNFW